MKLPAKLTRRVVLQTTLTISNMPGPTEPVTFGGNPIVQMFPIVTGIPQVNVQSIFPRRFRSFFYGVLTGTLTFSSSSLPRNPQTLTSDLKFCFSLVAKLDLLNFYIINFGKFHADFYLISFPSQVL